MLVFIGYEIREMFANNPKHPIPNYPLGLRNITMDTNLCSPCLASGYNINKELIFLYDEYEVVKNKFLSIKDWTPNRGNRYKNTQDDYSIFGYLLEEDFIKALAKLEEKKFGNDFRYFRRQKIVQEGLPPNLEALGFDVVEGFLWYDRWMSYIANDGISYSSLSEYGEINENGLYKNIEGAIKFKDELLKNFSEEEINAVVSDLPFIVQIIRCPLTS